MQFVSSHRYMQYWTNQKGGRDLWLLRLEVSFIFSLNRQIEAYEFRAHFEAYGLTLLQ